MKVEMKAERTAVHLVYMMVEMKAILTVVKRVGPKAAMKVEC